MASSRLPLTRGLPKLKNSQNKAYDYKITYYQYKGSEEECDEVSKSIEAYAAEAAIDAVIRTCIAHKDSLEDTISFVENQYEASEEYIVSRYKELSALEEVFYGLREKKMKNQSATIKKLGRCGLSLKK